MRSSPTAVSTLRTRTNRVFKSVFQQPENAAAELKHVLAPEHVSAIDWSMLKLEPGSFVDERLADKHSDLLFSAETRASGERVLVFLLLEHQSSSEPKMALRLLAYMVRIWARVSDADKSSPLPLIVPAVLAQVPDFSYAVDDLHQADDVDLKARAVAQQARLALWLMRDARDGALLLQRLVHWLGELEELAQLPGGERALAPLLAYVVRVSSDLQLEQFRAILKERAPAAESITMTIAEQLLAEGEARGVAQGELRRAAASVLTVLETRGLSVTAEVHAQIEGCQELDVLQHWLTRAVTAASADQIFEG